MKIWIGMEDIDARDYRIYLNGNLVTNAFEADEEAGKVYVHNLDEDSTRDYDVLYGNVEIIKIDRNAPPYTIISVDGGWLVKFEKAVVLKPGDSFTLTMQYTTEFIVPSIFINRKEN